MMPSRSAARSIALVVRVVGQADEVGVQLLEVAEDCVGIILRVGAAAANRGFRVHIDALEKDRRCH